MRTPLPCSFGKILSCPDEDGDEEGCLSEWRERMEASKTLPPLMAAGLALEVWNAIELLEHQAWLGAALLRARGKTHYHLPAMHAGFRYGKYRRSRQNDLATRLIAIAQAIETMANEDSKEVDTLMLAREILLRKCKGKRSNSKMPLLIDLFVCLPIVSVPPATKELGISQQAATTLICVLSSNPRELTGRQHYRAWAVM